MSSNIIQLHSRRQVERYRTYCPFPFFIDNEIKYTEFRDALKAAGMRIVTDPQHEGSHVVVKVQP